MSLRKYLLVIIPLVLISIIIVGQKQSAVVNTSPVHMLTLAPSVSREATREQLKTQAFDVLIIGGGATGAGAALDAANRGFKVALIERFDFASGTSSKSTKLLHGGVRYLEKAVFNLDKQQYDLVIEGLTERENLFQIAPHLTKPIEIITPIYTWWEIPYYWMGLKVYDWIASSASVPGSGYLLPSEIGAKIPQIRQTGLTGGVVYYDGQFNDTRFNMAVIKSALALQATVLNYAEAESFIYDSQGQIAGAIVNDKVSGERFEIAAKSVINATGPYVDGIRKMDNPQAIPVIMASSGTHMILDKELMPANAGLLVPKTKDDRVIFMLPWEGSVLIGTTDNPALVSDQPYPAQDDLFYLLSYVKEYLDVPVEASSVKSIWTGIRPLVQSPVTKNTASIVRDHFIEQSPSGLITITGGKWTTFRKMAEDVVDRVAEKLGSKETRVSTTQLRLVGCKGYDAALAGALVDEFSITKETSEYLVGSYGSIARDILEKGKLNSWNTVLVDGHPMLLSEVQWALEEEMAQKPMDILVRRTRLGTLDAQAAKVALPQVMERMQAYFGWNEIRVHQEMSEALSELNNMLP